LKSSFPSDPVFLKTLLEEKSRFYNQPSFIVSDPISIPHRFSRKEDIEIAGLLTAIIAWGNRKTIIRNASFLMSLMGNSPYQFILDSTEKDLLLFRSFVHRTFQGEDCDFLIRSLKHVYHNYGGLESLFSRVSSHNVRQAIGFFREKMLEPTHFKRSEKHLPDPFAGSAAKRINMFLRWMVRRDGNGVDFGLWKSLSPACLICPLDTHTARVSRQLGLLSRKTNDWQAAEELTANLRELDPDDPVRYDFALFGMGMDDSYIF
jgi:uncharacterized protein (TIGR02757 family)